jgi:hypothetical protein
MAAIRCSVRDRRVFGAVRNMGLDIAVVNSPD